MKTEVETNEIALILFSMIILIFLIIPFGIMMSWNLGFSEIYELSFGQSISIVWIVILFKIIVN